MVDFQGVDVWICMIFLQHLDLKKMGLSGVYDVNWLHEWQGLIKDVLPGLWGFVKMFV